DREDSYGLDDIYISRNQVEGWSKPENLGPLVNSFAYEYGAWVDAKSGFLYFNSYRRGTSDIYRMPLRDVEPLRHLLLKTP
ncbi:MAG: flagellar motor protein MotB, partial [Bacteroidota bacterium]